MRPTIFSNDVGPLAAAPLRPRFARGAIASVVLMVAACAHDAPTDTAFDADDEPLHTWLAPALSDVPLELVVPTYDGSGQSVHPDIVAFPDSWSGAYYWMAMTPYPNGDPTYENPSLLK